MTYAVVANVTDMDALMTALDTFLTSTDGSWTQDAFSTAGNVAEWHRTSGPDTYVSFRWEDSGVISMHHALGYDGSGPGLEPDDSGNGDDTGPITAERRISGLGSGPYTNLYMMSDDAGSGGTYVHVIIEFSAGQYRHFSFGLIDKRGTWTGGSYAVAHHWDNSASNNDAPLDTRHTFLWEARHTFTNGEPGTLHVEDLPGQNASSQWGIFWAGTAPGNDSNSNPRVNIVGGVRDGPNTIFTFFGAADSNGFVPLVEIPLFYRNLSPSPDEWYLLGYAPGVRLVNMRNLSPAEEIVIGSNTWKIFPWVRKRFQQDNNEESHNHGIAYLKIT